MDRVAALVAIQRLMQAPGPVARETLEAWMNSQDLEVQGATYHLLAKVGNEPRVTPPPPPERFLGFYKAYLERCIREDTPGEWAHSRYSAGSEIASWVRSLFDNPSVPRAVIAHLRDWLGSMYMRASSEERDALVNGALEHLFERRAIRKLFGEWRKDPVLARAYADAALWAEHGGDSPLVGRRKPQRRARGKR